MFINGTEHTIELPLFDTFGDEIEGSIGDVTTEISQDSGPYTPTTNDAEYVDEELWTLTLTDPESTCDRYRIRVTHADLQTPIIYTDTSELTRTNLIQVGGVAVELESDFGTATNQASIISHLTDIKGTGWTSSTDTLDSISEKIDTATLTPTEIAEEILKFDIATIEDSAANFSLCTVILANFSSLATEEEGWTIYKTNGIDVHWTRAVSYDTGASPVVGVGG